MTNSPRSYAEDEADIELAAPQVDTQVAEDTTGFTSGVSAPSRFNFRRIELRTVLRVASMLLLFILIVTGATAVISYLGVPQTPIPPVVPVGPQANTTATLLLISIDGFRYDYWNKPNLNIPTLSALRANGTFVERLVPIFPANTFPNQYALVTGLYAESHGIVDNTMYDPVFDATFYLGSAETQNSRWWQGGEPVWVTAERQNVTAASVFWPGSDVPIRGVLPTYYMPYNSNFPHASRVSKILEWLDKPAAERPHFLSIYYSAVDSAGHSYGPDSPEVFSALESVDSSISTLMDGLQTRGLLSSINIMVVGDHGMSQTVAEQKIVLDNYFDFNAAPDVRIVEQYASTVVMFAPQERVQSLYTALNGAHPKMTVYLHDEVPERFHYRNNRRIGAIVATAEEGWYIVQSASMTSTLLGNHGYDNRALNMSTLFIANGPAFKQAAVYPELDNINVYEIMCSVLGIVPAPNNGSLTAYQHILAAK